MVGDVLEPALPDEVLHVSTPQEVLRALLQHHGALVPQTTQGQGVQSDQSTRTIYSRRLKHKT